VRTSLFLGIPEEVNTEKVGFRGAFFPLPSLPKKKKGRFARAIRKTTKVVYHFPHIHFVFSSSA
jgi:hypothetical protein